MRAYVPLYLAVNYILFAFSSALGVLQAAAIASGDHKLIIFPNHPRAGQIMADIWIVGTFAIFWFFAPELLTPGPAGTELTMMFGASALMALICTKLLVWLCRPATAPLHYHSRAGDRRPPTADQQTNKPANQQTSSTHISRITLYVLLSILIAAFDLPLFRAFNGLAGRYGWLDVVFQFLINDYIVPTALVLALLGLWFAGQSAQERTSKQLTVLRAILALLLTNFILALTNSIYFRPRPFTSYEVTLIFYHPSDSSFPSNAAAVGFALAITVWFRYKRWGRWMIALASALALARVCSGVHFPLDIIAGAWLSGLAAWALYRATWLDKPLKQAIKLARRMALA